MSHPTQRSTVHVAAPEAPHDSTRWRAVGPGQWHWLFRNGTFCMRTGARAIGAWPAEESDLGKLSERFPGVLFVSDSVCTSKPDRGVRWRMFALDGATWRTIETDGAWAPPLGLGLDSIETPGADVGGMSPSRSSARSRPVRSGAGKSPAAGRLGTDTDTSGETTS